jgi:hypothetical protein
VKSVIAKVTGHIDQSIADEHEAAESADAAVAEDAARSGISADADLQSDSDSDAQSSYSSAAKWKSQPCCRVDFELDSSVLEGISETIGIIRSHFCYWDHRSVAALIVAIMHAPSPISVDVEFGGHNFGGTE